MGLFDGHFDPDQFGNGGGLLGRLLQQQQDQHQPGADLDQAPAAPQASAPMPLPLPNVSASGQPSTPDLHSQYQALRPVLGDRNAMLAAVSPEVGQTLIAQALANQQPDNAANVVQAGYRLGGIPFPAAPGPPPPIAMPAVTEWWKAVRVFLQLYPEILKGTFGDAAPGGSGPVVLNNNTANRPPAGSRPISETNWSGDHGESRVR